ncbi:MAG: hypothetical protein H0V81_02035 [Solirubrobacterales bacterium]|nr:hypothetical protein [Solirubrobacterales bacterium]
MRRALDDERLVRSEKLMVAGTARRPVFATRPATVNRCATLVLAGGTVNELTRRPGPAAWAVAAKPNTQQLPASTDIVRTSMFQLLLRDPADGGRSVSERT